jgi:hypothetical protein
MRLEAINHLWFRKNHLMIVVENRIKFTRVLRQGKLITRPEEPNRPWCIVVYDLETL